MPQALAVVRMAVACSLGRYSKVSQEPRESSDTWSPDEPRVRRDIRRRLLVGRLRGDPSQGEACPISDGPPLHHTASEVVVDPDRLELVAVPHLEWQEAGEAQLPDAAPQLEGGGGPE